MKLDNYMQDGSNYQARATLCFLQRQEGIEGSWSEKFSEYLGIPEVSRWENGREQGYVISLRSEDYKRQINIAFFEHRNSDNICAVEWEQKTMSAPTIDTAEFGDAYKTKYDVSHSEDYGKCSEMADWIWKRLETFWANSR